MTCFGQWTLANVTDRHVSGTCPLGLDLLLFLEPWDHDGSEPELPCWGMRGHVEENRGIPVDSLLTQRASNTHQAPSDLSVTTGTSKSPGIEPGSVQNCPQNREKL